MELKIPKITSSLPINDICGSGTTTINVTNNSMSDPLNGVEVQWWDSLINGTLIATGNSLPLSRHFFYRLAFSLQLRFWIELQ